MDVLKRYDQSWQDLTPRKYGCTTCEHQLSSSKASQQKYLDELRDSEKHYKRKIKEYKNQLYP